MYINSVHSNYKVAHSLWFMRPIRELINFHSMKTLRNLTPFLMHYIKCGGHLGILFLRNYFEFTNRQKLKKAWLRWFRSIMVKVKFESRNLCSDHSPEGEQL